MPIIIGAIILLSSMSSRDTAPTPSTKDQGPSADAERYESVSI